MKEKVSLKSYPGIKNAILLCLLFLGIQLGLSVILGVFMGIFGIGTESLVYGIATMVGNLIAFCVVILIGFRKTKRQFNEVFKFKGVPLSLWCAVIVFMLGFIFISSELDNLLKYLLPPPAMFQDVFTSLTVDQLFIVALLVIGIMPALFEELFFRGLILDGLKDNYSPVKAIVVSSLLFGIIHLNPWQFVSAFIIGLFSAWICIKSKSILPSMYIHLFNNTLYLLVMKFPDSVPIRGFNAFYDAAVVEFQPLWLDISAVAVTLLGLFLLKRNFDKHKQENPV
jgi:membrane protease YdiL (CAAX protease family)